MRLLDEAQLRVGNAEYARTNGTFGATTLQKRHAALRGSTLRLQFRGKSGARRDVRLDDPRLARVVRRCQDLPGQDLFRFVDADGTAHDLESGHVNAYLRRVTGRNVRSKDFRTWNATVCVAAALRTAGPRRSQAAQRRTVVAAIAAAAARLGNTPAVCRSAYVHPAVVAGYLDGSLLGVRAARRARDRLDADERTTLRFLRRLRRVRGRAGTRPARRAPRA